MPSPKRDRPLMPDGYGVPDHGEGLLDWGTVENRLTTATSYWLATTRPDRSPHVVPRWGVWLDGRFWYDGSPDTVHVRNLDRNQACALHLESGSEAVIVEGQSDVALPPGPCFGARLAEAFGGKYQALGYAPEPDSWDGPGSGGLRVLTPAKAIAWFDFPNDVTRFRFDDDLR